MSPEARLSAEARGAAGALPALLLSMALLGAAAGGAASEPPDILAPEEPSPMAEATGRELMEAVYQRHQQYPYVFEAQSMVLIDRNGDRETRKLRRFSRVEEDGSARLLLLFDSPPEVEGVALLASRGPDGTVSRKVYLPALGPVLLESDSSETADQDRNNPFLGTDFSIEDLTGEILDDYRYVRRRDIKLDEVPYFVVDVFDPAADPTTAPPLRRHYVLQGGLYITRTDHFDELGRLKKRQTHHDLTAVNGEMWRSNMMLMVNRLDEHRTLIKIHRRVFSPQYVPEEVFTAEWLRDNVPPLPPAGEETEVEQEDDVEPAAEAEGARA